jgi:hypothetical protein
MRAKLASLAAPASAAAADTRKANQAQLDYLREQIEMRVVGLGFVEFKPAWSSSKDEEIGTVADLTELLRNILMEEAERASCDELPEVAVVPMMKRKTFKELGTPTAQATALAKTIKELSDDELLARAQEKRRELEAAGEIDLTADLQDDGAPAIDDSLVGSWLEICWRYWRPPTEEEVAKGEKRKKIGVKIWCEGEVVVVANGTSTLEKPESAKCKKLAEAGAVRIRWPADLERKERESFSWHIFQDALFNQDKHLGWRFTAAELQKRAATAQPVPKRHR